MPEVHSVCDNLGGTACCAGPCAKMRALGRDPYTNPRPGDVWLVPYRGREEEATVKRVGGEVYFDTPGWLGNEWHGPQNRGHFPSWVDIALRDNWRFLRHDPTRTVWVLNPHGGAGAYPSYVPAIAVQCGHHPA